MPTCNSCSNPISKSDRFCPYCEAPTGFNYAPTVVSSTAASVNSVVAAAPNRVSSVMTRYRDAYLVARVTDGFGRLIKTIGIVASILLILVGIVLLSNGRGGDATTAMGGAIIAFGIFVGVLLYLLGVLVSAQGQILKATLDSAVNSSPFLTDEHKATVMSLPQA